MIGFAVRLESRVFFSSLTDLFADGEQLVTRERFSGFSRVDLQAGFLGNCFAAINITLKC